MPKASRFSANDLNEMADLYANGWSTHQIAARFDTNSGTVSYHFKRLGTSCRTITEAMRRYTVREDAFSSIPDADTAYWLGFLFADGCVYTRTGRAERGIVVALQKGDRHHLERFRTFLASEHPITCDARYGTVRLAISSCRLADDLQAWGCMPRKSSIAMLKPPPALPNSLFHHFVRGYFDGDGSAFLHGGSPTVTFCGNLEFLTCLQGRILVQAKIGSRLYPHSRSMQAWYLVFRGWERCQRFGAWLYRDAATFLERKRARIESFNRTGVGSAGQVSEETINQYIASQKERS